MHEKIVNGMLSTADWVVDHDNIQLDERMRAVRETSESVKAELKRGGTGIEDRSYERLDVGDGSIPRYFGEGSEPSVEP